MQTIKQSKKGIEYLITTLRDTKQTYTSATLWRIPHTNPETIDFSLKIGRYKKNNDTFTISIEELESNNPKSLLTLDNAEFQNLLLFLQENYEPFKHGIKRYIPIDESFEGENLEHLKAVFTNPDKELVLRLVIDNEILPDDLILAVEHKRKMEAVKAFESLLQENNTEHLWQKWFQENSWVLGSEFIRVLDERDIDTHNISDFLMEAYDGFLDIVEIKRPEGGLTFWANSSDHDNLVPSQHLIKAITQSNNYIYEVERESNSVKFQERVGGIKVIKPRCILIFGRSNKWTVKHYEAYRILNASFHNLTILTYDQVLERAKRILGLIK
jgi:Domain of unknown function (DUF4263)